MMYAREARELAEKDANTAEVERIIEKLMPAASLQVAFTANDGLNETMLKKAEIMRIAGFTFCTYNCIMDALAQEIREYGYDVTITPSYSSIHIKW